MGIEDGIGDAAEQAKKVVTGENESEDQQENEDGDTDDSAESNMEYERD